MKHLKVMFACMLMLLLSAAAYAQNKISGNVSDANGEPVIGASVMVKGTTNGTVTNLDGNFSLNASGKGTLVISYIGYKTLEIPISSGTMKIVLKEDTEVLDEVVVVGYGTQKKESLTGAITQVKEDVFINKPVSNPALALQGEVPGLTITRTSSRPGNEDLTIRIRGEASIEKVEPLIIIDGVPVIGTWELSNLNPNDIESMSVLKDASAAIYGARSAGGVILVTTKRGKGEKMQISYNGNLRINTVGITTPWANMQEWATEYIKTAAQDKVDPKTGKPVNWFPQWNGVITPGGNADGSDYLIIHEMAKGLPFDYTDAKGKKWGYGDNNYFDDLYGTTVSHQHNVSLRGSTEKTAYMASVGYADNRSMVTAVYDGEKKYNARFNYDYTISKRVKLQTNFSYDDRIVDSPTQGLTGSNGSFFDAPVFPTYNPLGQYYDQYSGTRNPVSQVHEGGRTINEEALLRLGGRLVVDVMKGLTLTGNASVVKRQGWKKTYFGTYENYSWDGTTSTINNTKAKLTEEIKETVFQNYGLQLDYRTTIAKAHNLAAMIGLTAERTDYKFVKAERAELLYDGLHELNTANSDNQTNNGEANQVGLVSYIGRLNYDYKGRYLLEVLGRRDGSSKFHPDYRWSNFGAASVGWRVSEETWVKNLNIFDNLKIRAGYGETGGQAGIDNYDYVASITTGTAVFGYGTMGKFGTAWSGLASLSRTWERIKNSNVGVDFGFLDNRLTGSFDWFERKNDGMLIGIVYPEVLGGGAPKSNNGVLSVKGWEVALNWRDRIGQVNYNVGVQLSDNKNNLESMEGQESWTAGKVAQRQGYPLNSLFVYKTEGYFKDNAEVEAYYKKYGNDNDLAKMKYSDADNRLRPGDLKRVDLDGSNTISAIGKGKAGDGDVYYYGDTDPHYLYGVNLGAEWKNFDFSAFIQGVGKQNVLRNGNARAPFFRNYLNTNNTFIGKTWTEENSNSEYPRLSFNNNRNDWNYQNNDVNVQNLRYARLKSLVVGYTLPKVFTQKAGIDRVRFYFSGGDLCEISSIKDGFDPERGESADSSMPFSRTWSFGLDIAF